MHISTYKYAKQDLLGKWIRVPGHLEGHCFLIGYNNWEYKNAAEIYSISFRPFKFMSTEAANCVRKRSGLVFPVTPLDTWLFADNQGLRPLTVTLDLMVRPYRIQLSPYGIYPIEFLEEDAIIMNSLALGNAADYYPPQLKHGID